MTRVPYVKGRASTMFTEDPDLASGQKPETEKRDGAEDQSLSLPDFSVSSRPPSALRADPELPFLEMAWSPSQMQEFFNHQVLPAVWPGQHVTAVTIEDIRYEAGNQCEVLYSLQCGAPTAGHSQRAVVTFASQNKLGRI